MINQVIALPKAHVRETKLRTVVAFFPQASKSHATKSTLAKYVPASEEIYVTRFCFGYKSCSPFAVAMG